MIEHSVSFVRSLKKYQRTVICTVCEEKQLNGKIKLIKFCMRVKSLNWTEYNWNSKALIINA